MQPVAMLIILIAGCDLCSSPVGPQWPREYSKLGISSQAVTSGFDPTSDNAEELSIVFYNTKTRRLNVLKTM